MTFFYCQQTPARRHCINGVNYGPERIEKRQILHKQNKYWILSWTRARAQRHNKKPRTEGRAVLRAALRLGMEMEERGGDWCQVTEERNEETKTSERKGENGRGGKKPFIFSYVFFFALTLKDTSLLMSQKALNNTTDQYISPLMGFSTRAALAQSPEHSQTHEKNDRKPTRARTHQYAIWHMAASSTAQSVKRQMEQWKRHTRGLITTLSSRLPRAQALISITELLTAAPFVLLCVFLSFFFVSPRWASVCYHEPTPRRRGRASLFHKESRRLWHVCFRSNAQTSFVKSAVRSRRPNAEWTAPILLHRLLREFTADFNWSSRVGPKKGGK